MAVAPCSGFDWGHQVCSKRGVFCSSAKFRFSARFAGCPAGRRRQVKTFDLFQGGKRPAEPFVDSVQAHSSCDLAWLRQLGRVTRSVKQLNPRRSRGSLRKTSFQRRRLSACQGDLHPIELRRRHFENLHLVSPKIHDGLHLDSAFAQKSGEPRFENSAGLTPYNCSQFCAGRRHSHCGASPSLAVSPPLPSRKRTTTASAKAAYNQLTDVHHPGDELSVACSSFLAQVEHPEALNRNCFVSPKAPVETFAKQDAPAAISLSAAQRDSREAVNDLCKPTFIKKFCDVSAAPSYADPVKADSSTMRTESQTQLCPGKRCNASHQLSHPYSEPQAGLSPPCLPNEQLLDCFDQASLAASCDKSDEDFSLSADLERVKKKLDFSSHQQVSVSNSSPFFLDLFLESRLSFMFAALSLRFVLTSSTVASS